MEFTHTAARDWPPYLFLEGHEAPDLLALKGGGGLDPHGGQGLAALPGVEFSHTTARD